MLYESKSRPWEALELLAPLTSASFRLNADERAAFEPLIWDDLCSEYDAEHLCLELERLADAGTRYSAELWSFERVWRRDEYNHYRGFQRLYALLYDADEDHVAARLHQRAADFSGFGAYLTDEFKLCLMLAYDELCTTRAYANDVPFYQSLGDPIFVTWVERVRGDEARHYLNALRVAQTRHRDRLAEAPAIIADILATDLATSDYRGTFILDHHGPSYSPDLLRAVAATLAAVIQRPWR